HVVTAVVEDGPGNLAARRVVVDDQDGRHAPPHSTRNVLPDPGVLCNPSWTPHRAATRPARYSPSPVPSTRRSAAESPRTNASKIRYRSAGATPGPASLTSITAPVPAVGATTRTRTSDPSVYLTALSTSSVTKRRNMSGSPGNATGRSGTSTRRRGP